jgi:hypothetical protein
MEVKLKFLFANEQIHYAHVQSLWQRLEMWSELKRIRPFSVCKQHHNTAFLPLP